MFLFSYEDNPAPPEGEEKDKETSDAAKKEK